MAFDKKALRQYIKDKGITQEHLAHLAGRDIRTIRRWLSPKYRLSTKSIDQMCAALGVDPESFDPNWEEGNLSHQSVQISARVSIASANYYALLKKQYGVTQKDLVELAPAMFAIIAKRALGIGDRLEEQLSSAEALMNKMGRIGEYSQIDTYGVIAGTIESARHAEEKGALFGTQQDYPQDHYETGNLFARELNELSKDFDEEATFSTYPSKPTCVGQVLPISLIKDLCGENKEFISAVAKGMINLGKMHDHLWKPENTTERLDWMAKQLQTSKERLRIEEAAWRKANPKQAKSMDAMRARIDAILEKDNNNG